MRRSMLQQLCFAGSFATLAGCAGVSRHVLRQPGPIECERYIAAAHAAAATPPDSLGVPAPQLQGEAMARYHACVADADARRKR